MLTFHIITIFPDIVTAYTKEGILSRAIKSGKIKVLTYNPRDFTMDKHKRVDDSPYGGGPGMVMMAEPILKAAKKAVGRKKSVLAMMMSPSGKLFDNKYASKLAKEREIKDILIISGRYEGVDARVAKILKAKLVSTGPYVLSGGELPALAIVDAVSRQVEGVLGNEMSIEERRDASPVVYTRPEIMKWPKGKEGKNHKVPKVLLSGDHKKIIAWRKER